MRELLEETALSQVRGSQDPFLSVFCDFLLGKMENFAKDIPVVLAKTRSRPAQFCRRFRQFEGYVFMGDLPD